MSNKIAYIITLPDLGGAQSHLSVLMPRVREYGFEPILLVGGSGWLTDEAKAHGIKCYIVSSLVRQISPWRDLHAVWDILKILRREKPALVHCHSSKAGIVGRVAARLYHVPAIFTAHGWAFTDGVGHHKRIFYRWLENMAGYLTNSIICVSEYDRALGKRYLPRHYHKMVTVHNGIPDAPENVRDYNERPVGEEVHVVVVARFSPPKKNLQILRLLKEWLDAGIAVTVTFIGDGPDLSSAQAEAARLGLADKAVFLGARTDVAELLPKYDVFLLLSNWEGFPISILEAMRAGLPVIASDVGGVSEAVIDGVTGWLVRNEYDDVISFKSLWIGKESIQEMGKCARTSYLENFSADKMYQDIVVLYKKLLDRKEG